MGRYINWPKQPKGNDMENVYNIIELFGMIFQGFMYAGIGYAFFRGAVAVRNFNRVNRTATRYINKRR